MAFAALTDVDLGNELGLGAAWGAPGAHRARSGFSFLARVVSAAATNLSSLPAPGKAQAK